MAHQIAESIGKTEGLLDGLALGEREDSQQALERVAIEYNQLKFLLGKGKRLPPVESQKTLEVCNALKVMSWILQMQTPQKISLLEARLKDILSQALQDAFRALQPVLESSPLSLKNASTIPPIKKQARSNKDQEELLMNLSRTCVLLDKVTLIANHFRDVIVDPFIQRVSFVRYNLLIVMKINCFHSQLCRPLTQRASRRPLAWQIFTPSSLRSPEWIAPNIVSSHRAL